MNLVLVAVAKNLKNVVGNEMKIWIHDTKTPTHRLVKLNCEQHSDFSYAGNFTDDELELFLLNIDAKMNIKKNIKLIKYYGYLHLFVISK